MARRRLWWRAGVLLAAVGGLAVLIYFKSSAIGGFNPIVALPVVYRAALPDELSAYSGCPAARSVMRSFDLNQDGEKEFFLECLADAGKPSTITVLARQNGVWETLASGQILGVLQSRTNGYYDLLLRIPPDPPHGRFQTRTVPLTWRGRSYGPPDDAR